MPWVVTRDTRDGQGPFSTWLIRFYYTLHFYIFQNNIYIILDIKANGSSLVKCLEVKHKYLILQANPEKKSTILTLQLNIREEEKVGWLSFVSKRQLAQKADNLWSWPDG